MSRLSPALLANTFKYTILIYPLNVRGLRNDTKHKAIFLFCKEQPKVNCCFLQETYSIESDVKFWKSQWGSGDIFFFHSTSQSAGVAILINQLDCKIIDHKSDTDTGLRYYGNMEINGCKYIYMF